MIIIIMILILIVIMIKGTMYCNGKMYSREMETAVLRSVYTFFNGEHYYFLLMYNRYVFEKDELQ